MKSIKNIVFQHVIPKLLIGVSSFFLTGCLAIPEHVTPVKEFELDRYLGTWYEIARLDHSFERGLDNVTASYALQEDGGITVINRGYSTEEKSWKEAEGRAYFVNDENEGYLKVSFFGPFYSSYIVFELDKEHYQYAFVCGYNTSYLWLLSRTPQVDRKRVKEFIGKAQKRGFATDNLILVHHQNGQ